jgi:ABC-type glycerol-3-phosphate transport system substrate-binding protein
VRWAIAILVALWGLLTAFGYLVVVPDDARDAGVIAAYLAVADDPGHERTRDVVEGFAEWLEARGAPPPLPAERLPSVLGLPTAERRAYFDAFRQFAAQRDDLDLAAVPTLVWSTDDNPARPLQCALFREWRLRTYGEPADIITDPSNRDITKAIVQCVAGAGPDIIEAYGPAQLQQVVGAGLAHDVTDVARERGFDVSRVFETAVPSIATGGRQYAFPCNIGYTVLFYHRDLFRRAGVPEPGGPWSYDEFLEACRELVEAGVCQKPFVYVNFTPWDMTLPLGIDFLNEDATASFYNQPATVAALQAYLDIVYRHKMSPSPAEAASKATSGGANMNADAQSASASAFFLNKDAAMVIDGRWQYVSMALRNWSIIEAAVERRLAALPGGGAEADLLRSARRKIDASPLNALTDAEMDALRGVLTDADRARMLDIGIGHVPTYNGTPFYKANARMAIVNKGSKHRDLAVQFLEFLSTESYNDHINETFDSICGVPAFCFDEDGISGPPQPLPGLERFDSPIFAEAVRDYASPDKVSPFIGQARLGDLVKPFMERLQNDAISPVEAAAGIEDVINGQIRANLIREPELRAEWERRTGRAFDPELGLREQLEEGAP